MISVRHTVPVALAALLAACAGQPQPPLEPDAPPAAPPPVTQPVVPAAPPAPPEPDRSAMRISIAAVGDMMIGTDFPENHLPDDDGVSFLADVTPVLSAADVAFGNLEGVLVDDG